MNAKEAREKATPIYQIHTEIELASIRSAIEYAVNLGWFSVCIEGTISDKAKHTLVQEGFSVMTPDITKDGGTTISW